jgi:C_GCAxxG_C_C family probable redox protein
VGQEKLDRIDEEVVKSVGAFGGGIASSGSMCGIVLGGVALISSLYSRGNLDGKENPRMWSLSAQFIKEFEKLAAPYGGVNCRDIARVDWRNRDAVREYYGKPEGRRKICIELVGDATRILGELLEQEEAK